MKPPGMEDCVARAMPKLEELTRIARGKQTLLAQTHDYPDPDTIGSALALGWLLQELTGIEPTLGYSGVIGRAENKTMIRVLGIKMKRTSEKDLEKYDLIALLDTQPEVGNHPLPHDAPDIVFDHHFPRDLSGETPEFFDVGGDYGATSTKVVELIMASGLQPPTQVATALFYGVKSDTMNLARDASPADVAAYLYLFQLADTRLLAEIENPQVPLDYFRVFNKSLTQAKIYGSMVVSDLGEVYTPDLCAEVAERLLQIEGVKHALAVGWFEEQLFLSLRTRSRNRNAGKILHSIVNGGGYGTAGGHGPMAGARISVEGKSQRARTDMRRAIVNQVVQAFKEDYRHFHRILSKKDQSLTIEPPPPRVPEAKNDKKKSPTDPKVGALDDEAPKKKPKASDDEAPKKKPKTSDDEAPKKKIKASETDAKKSPKRERKSTPPKKTTKSEEPPVASDPP